MMSKQQLEEALNTKGAAFRLNINGLDFAFEKRLYKKLRVMCRRITHKNLDAFLINEGYEGDGKTNSSLVEAIIVQQLLAEKFHSDIHVFFKISSAIEFVKRTKNKIIILDEPALELLSVDSQTTTNKDFFRLTSLIRKRGHFFILNFTKFWKFPEFIVVDRALGMVRMNTKNGKHPGRFIYIRRKKLSILWNEKKKHNKKIYQKVKSFGGVMPYLMVQIFSNFVIHVEGKAHCSYDEYDNIKDEAIESIGEEKVSKKELFMREKIEKFQWGVANLWKRFPTLTQADVAAHFGISSARLREWITALKGKFEEITPPTSRVEL